MYPLFADLWVFSPLLIVAGAFAGFLAGLFGIGGGLVVVPALFSLLQYKGVFAADAMAMALATSLASIIPTSLSSLNAHRRLGNIRVDILRIWWLPLVMGVLIGSMLIAQLRSRYFIIYFAIFLGVIACYSMVNNHNDGEPRAMPRLSIQAILAGILGFLSVIAGVGGGSLGVPLLKKLGASAHQAVGTCSALGFCIALPGAISLAIMGAAPNGAPYGSIGLVYIPALLLMSPFTVLCAPIGAAVGKKISAKNLMRLFGIFLLAVAIKMLISGVNA